MTMGNYNATKMPEYKYRIEVELYKTSCLCPLCHWHPVFLTRNKMLTFPKLRLVVAFYNWQSYILRGFQPSKIIHKYYVFWRTLKKEADMALSFEASITCGQNAFLLLRNSNAVLVLAVNGSCPSRWFHDHGWVPRPGLYFQWVDILPLYIQTNGFVSC